MKELLEYLAKSLVDHPDAVRVQEEHRGEALVFRLIVDQADVGQVIGRQGRIAKAIRNIVSAAAYHQQKHVIVDIES